MIRQVHGHEKTSNEAEQVHIKTARRDEKTTPGEHDYFFICDWIQLHVYQKKNAIMRYLDILFSKYTNSAVCIKSWCVRNKIKWKPFMILWDNAKWNDWFTNIGKILKIRGMDLKTGVSVERTIEKGREWEKR